METTQQDIPSLPPALSFKIQAECSTSRVRVGLLHLPHQSLATPIFMPVGTQASLKGLTPDQVRELGCHLLLGNTYHLGLRPGADLVGRAGGLHSFMGWDRALLTDSGGFQMVSLHKLSEVSEEGVRFRSPYTDQEIMLTPEKSVEIQNSLGADILMQLDDVVHVSTRGPRVEEAVHRSIRWLDRCIAAHTRLDKQALFAIVQGGLDPELRQYCAAQMVARDTPGYAIGGLSGGEDKNDFWRTVLATSRALPPGKPRYCMGVGYPLDLLVCSALGVDMYDCVFPTRTARFGSALVAAPPGQLDLKGRRHALELGPLEPDCPCPTCRRFSRAYLHGLVVNRATAGCHLLSIHNLTHLMRLMAGIRESVAAGHFPQFVRRFMATRYPEGDVPAWAVDALAAVNIHL